MIGWENNQGAYYIDKLEKSVSVLSDAIDDAKEEIGNLTDLSTTAKTNIVAAINELVTALSGIPSIPSAPSESGTYVLVVADGVATWTVQGE